MGRLSSGVSTQQTRRFSSLPFALFGGALLIYSADRLLDLSTTGPAWRVGLYAVTAMAALGTLIAGLRRPPGVPDVTGPWVAEAKQILASGDKIGAIKVVRNATRLGLAEAKSLVESWTDAERPANQPLQPTSGGTIEVE
jgi:hypothetical protein